MSRMTGHAIERTNDRFSGLVVILPWNRNVLVQIKRNDGCINVTPGSSAWISDWILSLPTSAQQHSRLRTKPFLSEDIDSLPEALKSGRAEIRICN